MSLLDVFVSYGVNALFDKRARFLRTRSRNDRRELGVYSEREYLLFVGKVILEAPITCAGRMDEDKPAAAIVKHISLRARPGVSVLDNLEWHLYPNASVIPHACT